MAGTKNRKTEKTHIHLRLPENMVERIRDEAYEKGQPLCVFVERVMDEYFEREAKGERRSPKKRTV